MYWRSFLFVYDWHVLRCLILPSTKFGSSLSTVFLRQNLVANQQQEVKCSSRSCEVGSFCFPDRGLCTLGPDLCCNLFVEGAWNALVASCRGDVDVSLVCLVVRNEWLRKKKAPFGITFLQRKNTEIDSFDPIFVTESESCQIAVSFSCRRLAFSLVWDFSGKNYLGAFLKENGYQTWF